jgi:hypothetical protein
MKVITVMASTSAIIIHLHSAMSALFIFHIEIHPDRSVVKTTFRLNFRRFGI